MITVLNETKKQKRYLDTLNQIQALEERAKRYCIDADLYAVCYGIVYLNGESIIKFPVFIAEDEKEYKRIANSYIISDKGNRFPERRIRYFTYFNKNKGDD